VGAGTAGRETPMLKPKETFVGWQAYLRMESLPTFFGGRLRKPSHKISL
jgi:hypothetical protein